MLRERGGGEEKRERRGKRGEEREKRGGEEMSLCKLREEFAN